MYKHTEAFNDKWINEIVFPNVKGFFVEAGAVDGISGSTCFALERKGWSGICIEANKYEFNNLKKNRKSKCINAALSDKTDIVEYYVSNNKYRSGIYQCLKEHKNSEDKNSWDKRGKKDLFSIRSVSLNDLLKENDAPSTIHYVSLDIEGSEYNALSAFNFEGPYKILALTIEGYNCIKLMKEKGYLHVNNPFNKKANYEQYFIHPELKDKYPSQHLHSTTKIPKQFV